MSATLGRIRPVWVAILAGLLLSSVLFIGSHFTPNYFLYWLQAIGLYTCMVIRGVHTSTEADFATIAIPINAAIYAFVIFGLMRFRAKRNTSNAPAGRATDPNS